MHWLLVNTVSIFLLPPFNLLILGMMGVFLLRSRPRLAKVLIISSFVLLYLISTPFFASRLLHSVETIPTLTAAQRGADAIVVLGAGTYFNAPEYGGDTVNQYALERLRYGARLYRRYKKPLLVSGGNPAGGKPEALLMKEALIVDFRVTPKWTESFSSNTDENARFSFKILKSAGISHILLVTHAWHMPRATASFTKAGFIVTPAPTGFTTSREPGIQAFLPRAPAMMSSYIAMREWIGRFWYFLAK